MSTSRPKLTLDEQSFQDMLAAAFTIQEHNAKRRRSQEPQHVCTQCGAPAREGERLCELCSAEEQRPGEQLQRKWASMWLMSQEQGVFDQPAASNHTPGETVREHGRAGGGSRSMHLRVHPPRAVRDPIR